MCEVGNKMFLKLRLAFFVAFFVCLAISCKSLLQANRLADCIYDFDSFSDIYVADTKLDGVQQLSDLSLIDAGKMTAGFLTGDLPMRLTANISVTNPNKRPAAINSVDWILLVDGRQVATGMLEKRFEVGPNGNSAILPFEIELDLSEALKSDDKGRLMKFVFNLSGNNNVLPSDVTLKIKPSIAIGKKTVKVPGYIPIKKRF